MWKTLKQNTKPLSYKGKRKASSSSSKYRGVCRHKGSKSNPGKRRS